MNALTLILALAAAPAYDPLAVGPDKVKGIDLSFTDAARGREIALRVYLPKGAAPAAVVLFSHGLGGSRGASVFLAEQWAKRGYVAVFMQHPGSDEAVWKDVPAGKRMAALKQAANLDNLVARIADVPAVIDQLELWQKEANHPLFGRMDLKRLGMSGHSFGAKTTQAVSGERTRLGLFKKSKPDPRIRAAVVFSPSVPKNPADAKTAFSDVAIPWLLMTGTEDIGAIGGATVEDRLAVFPLLPKGNKYQLVLDKAEHSIFTDARLKGETEARNPKHQIAIRALSTAFWDAYLNDDAAAKAWLDGGAVRGVLEKGDRWERK